MTCNYIGSALYLFSFMKNVPRGKCGYNEDIVRFVWIVVWQVLTFRAVASCHNEKIIKKWRMPLLPIILLSPKKNSAGHFRNGCVSTKRRRKTYVNVENRISLYLHRLNIFVPIKTLLKPIFMYCDWSDVYTRVSIIFHNFVHTYFPPCSLLLPSINFRLWNWMCENFYTRKSI